MVHLKTLVLFTLISLQTFMVHADWRLTLERAGFFGTYSGGVSYQWNQRHALDLSLGIYSNDSVTYNQINISYKYSRWQVQWKNRTWIPTQIGIFTVRTLDKNNYFVRSPAEYPSEGYYDPTALRWGVLYGTSIEFPDSNFALSYYFKILDNGLVAIYNNSNMDLQYYISSGVGFHYIF